MSFLLIPKWQIWQIRIIDIFVKIISFLPQTPFVFKHSEEEGDLTATKECQFDDTQQPQE